MTPPNANDSAQLRLFVAVELPDAVRAALAEAIAMFKSAGIDEGLRWVRPEGIHLTLKFLGATPADRVPAITHALTTAFEGVSPFELQPAHFGAFHGGRPKGLRVLWIGVAGATDRLGDLASRIDAALTPLGYASEKRPYSAHLTLARTRDDGDTATRDRLETELAPYLSGNDPQRTPAFPAFTVDHVALMQSTLQPGGAVYRALHTFPLSP